MLRIVRLSTSPIAKTAQVSFETPTLYQATPTTRLLVHFRSINYSTMAAHEQRADAEKAIKRNPHPDFGQVQASRPDWDEAASEWTWTKTKDPAWKHGQGGNDGGESLKKNHVEIDPNEEGRPVMFNYKLLISAIVPRFIGFVSTRSKDGTQKPI